MFQKGQVMGKVNFFRYTDLPSLIHILRNRELSLLDPMSWDDKNDSSFVTLYKEKCGLKSVLALCFTRAPETYHHWRVFAPSPSGVRISFDEDLLRKSVSNTNGLKLEEVEYVMLKEIRSGSVGRDCLHFLKRYPFHPEKEVRLLWETRSEERQSFAVPIDLKSIRRITLSPWLHPALVDGIKSTLKSINGCESLNVYKTTLISNAEWLKHGAAAT